MTTTPESIPAQNVAPISIKAPERLRKGTDATKQKIRALLPQLFGDAVRGITQVRGTVVTHDLVGDERGSAQNKGHPRIEVTVTFQGDATALSPTTPPDNTVAIPTQPFGTDPSGNTTYTWYLCPNGKDSYAWQQQ